MISYEEELHPALQDYSEEERQEISALYEESVNKVLRFLRYPSLRGRLRKQGLSMSILTRERLPGDK